MSLIQKVFNKGGFVVSVRGRVDSKFEVFVDYRTRVESFAPIRGRVKDAAGIFPRFVQDFVHRFVFFRHVLREFFETSCLTSAGLKKNYQKFV